MTLKKSNAALSLFCIVLLFVHAVYQTVSYIVFYYNPFLSKLFGVLLAAAIVLHGILSCVSVSIVHDSRGIVYRRLNLRTFLQRLSAAGITVLLLPHIFSFHLLQKTAGTVFFIFLESAQILFFAALFLHAALSFSNAFVSLGLLSDIKKKRRIDAVAAVVCAVLFVLMSVTIIIVHLKLFYGGGEAAV